MRPDHNEEHMGDLQYRWLLQWQLAQNTKNDNSPKKFNYIIHNPQACMNLFCKTQAILKNVGNQTVDGTHW